MQERVVQHGMWFAKIVGFGLAVGTVLLVVFVGWNEATRVPTTLPGNGRSDQLSVLPPFVDGPWIKVPFDRERTEECLTQSTFWLVRDASYPPPLGQREDQIELAMLNNPISGLGQSRKLLWFSRPSVPPGDWTLVVDAGRDCGNWLNTGVSDSGPVALGRLHLDKAP